MKTIRVSEEVWAELTRMKLELRKRTLSDVIAELIEAWKRSRR